MSKESRALRAEIGGLRVDVAKIPLETVKWLLAVLGHRRGRRYFNLQDLVPLTRTMPAGERVAAALRAG